MMIRTTNKKLEGFELWQQDSYTAQMIYCGCPQAELILPAVDVERQVRLYLKTSLSSLFTASERSLYISQTH